MHTGFLQMALQELSQGQRGAGVSFSGSHSQSSSVAFFGLVQVILAAGLSTEGGTSAGWLQVRLVAWFWGLGCGWGTGFPWLELTVESWSQIIGRWIPAGW